MSNPYGTPPPFPNQPVSDPYQTSAAPPRAYQQVPTIPRRLATATIWLAVAYTAVQVITSAISYPTSVAGNDITNDASPTTATLIWVVVAFVGSLVVTAIMIPLYVVGCLWLQRSYDFAKAVSPTFHMRRSQVWVWLGWWVPIVSLWFPLQVVDDVRRATARSESRGSLAIWWAAWLIATWAGQVGTRIFLSEEVLSHDAIIVVAIFDAVVAVSLVIACAKWISIIRGITRDQETARP